MLRFRTYKMFLLKSNLYRSVLWPVKLLQFGYAMCGLQTCSSSIPCGSLCLSPVIPCGFGKNIDEYEHMNINVEII